MRLTKTLLGDAGSPSNSNEGIKMKFKTRQKVKVIHQGMRYSCYERWANKYNLKNFERTIAYNKNLDGTFTVVAVGPHLDQKTSILYGIHQDGIDYIVAEDGLELAEPEKGITITPDILKQLNRIMSEIEDLENAIEEKKDEARKLGMKFDENL